MPGARSDAGATAPAGSSTISDNAAVATDPGRTVTGKGISPGAHVGQVRDTPMMATSPNQDGGIVDTGAFALVDGAGHPITTTGPVNGVTLGTASPLPTRCFDAKHATTGGGDTGSVLISPSIRPGSVSTRFYNHCSWLRTMEDVFAVAGRSPGLDGRGHLGYAAQPGLAPFGRDVFTNPRGPRDGHGRRAGIARWLPGATMRVGRVLSAAPNHQRLAIAAWEFEVEID